MTDTLSDSKHSAQDKSNEAQQMKDTLLSSKDMTASRDEPSKTEHISAAKQEAGDMKKILPNIRTIIYALLFGILFGFSMNKGTVFVAPTIRMQMLFQRFAMLKMFLAAVGVSMLSVAFLGLCCGNLYRKVFDGYVEHNSRRGTLHYLFGGTLIGLGMVISGSCPGTVFVQVGSGILNSLFTCLGGLVGTYFYYALLHDRITREKLPPSSLVLRRLSDLIRVNSVIVHLVLGIVFLGISIGLEFVAPWQSDLGSSLMIKGTLNPDAAHGHIFGMAAWPPSVCGAGVGILQLFFIFFLEKSLGVSSAFTVFAAQICRIKLIGGLLPSLSSFAFGLKNLLALIFALGAIGGSALSSGLSGTFPLGPENGTHVFNSFFGGFLLLLGARCAGGCTSGQGISGMTHLLIGSFIATMSIFGGGIAFAFTYSLSNKEWLFNNL